MDYQVIVHAAGEGSRLRSISNGKPKALVEANGKPLVGYVIEPLIRAGTKHFIVTASIGIKDIKTYFKKYPIKAIFLEEKTPLGRGGAIRAGIEQGLIDYKKPTIIVQCDDIIKLDLLDLIKSHEASSCFATVVLAKNFMNPYGAANVKDRKVCSFTEKPDSYVEEGQGLSTGTIIINDLSLFVNIPSPSHPEHNIYPKLASDGKMGAYFVDEWYPINTKDDYNRFLKTLGQK